MEVEGSSRRPRQAVGEAGDSSHSRKRAHLSPEPQHPVNDIEQEPVSEADNDEITGQDSDDDDDEEEEEEEEEQSESESEGGYEDEEQSEGEYGSDGDDAVEDQHNEQQSQQGSRGGEDQPQRSRVVVLDDSNDDDNMPSTTPAPVPPPPSSCSDSSVVRDATVNSSALDCGICFLPLKPPIFQCIVGHAVCSPCHDKLGVPRSCHVCRALTPGGYQRCHAMEQLVDSIRVPCPHAAHGCTERPVYHSRESHAQACAHAPCHCPGQACSFVGSTEALLQHFADVHRWPCTTEDVHGWRCTTEDKASTGFDIKLRDGFNFVTAIRADANQGTSNKYLFLLNVERASFGHTITAFCIHPHCTSTATIKLTYSCYRMFDMCCMHRQSSEFKVACTDLSSGLPDPSKCFLFIVPRSACSDDEEFIKVTVIINQTPIQ